MSEDDGCDICVYDGDGEQADWSTEKWVSGRKQHRCCECGRVMARRERHHVTSGKWDGTFSSHRTCAGCHDVRVTFCCEGWTFGGLWEAISDQLFEHFSEACVAKLASVEGKTLLRDRWLRWKGLDGTSPQAEVHP